MSAEIHNEALIARVVDWAFILLKRVYIYYIPFQYYFLQFLML